MGRLRWLRLCSRCIWVAGVATGTAVDMPRLVQEAGRYGLLVDGKPYF